MGAADVVKKGSKMTPKEVIAMRDRLAEEFDSRFGREVSGSELADWLIGYGWVTREPDEDTN